MSKTLAKQIEKLTGVPAKRDFEVIGEFVETCLESDVNSSIEFETMFLAFRLYLSTRWIELKYSSKSFRSEMIERLWIDDKSSVKLYDGLRLVGSELVE